MLSTTLATALCTALCHFFRNPKLDRPAVPATRKANPSFEVLKVSYLWVEAYLTDVAGDDLPLCLHHRWTEGVCHHSLLDGVHLRTDNPELTSNIQQHRRSSEVSVFYVSPNNIHWLWMIEKGVKEKVQVNDRGSLKKQKAGRVNWRGSTDWCG